MSLFGLLNQNSGRFRERTVRVQEVAKRNGVMLVLVNYYFCLFVLFLLHVHTNSNAFT